MLFCKHFLQRRILIQPVAAVQELQPFAFGVGYAFVHSVVDAFVGLAAPIGKVVGILLYQLTAAVGTAAVDDNPFIVNECLADNAV